MKWRLKAFSLNNYQSIFLHRESCLCYLASSLTVSIYPLYVTQLTSIFFVLIEISARLENSYNSLRPDISSNAVNDFKKPQQKRGCSLLALEYSSLKVLCNIRPSDKWIFWWFWFLCVFFFFFLLPNRKFQHRQRFQIIGPALSAKSFWWLVHVRTVAAAFQGWQQQQKKTQRNK